MALLYDPNLDAALAAHSKLLLSQFDFDATLDPNDPLLRDAHVLPPGTLPLIESIEDASQEGNLSAVKESFARLRRRVPRDPILHTGRSLLRAIEQQYEDVVAYLLSEGVQISYYEVKRATLLKNKAILQLLFENGWEINREFGWSDPPALAYAVEDGDLAKWFLDHGADPNASCVLDKTPLSAAVKFAPLSVIEMLFNRGGSVEHGQLLHAATWRELDDRLAVVEYLLKKCAPVNAIKYHDKPKIYLMREPFGLGTPLHDAAALGDKDVLRLLVSHGARLDAKDSLGLLAFDRAEKNGHSAAAQYLRDITL